MGRLIHLHGDAHEQTLKLLPWYLNGTLDDAEAAMVEAHFAECPLCRREAETERAMRNGVTSVGVDVDHGWAAMVRKLEEAETPPVRRPPPPPWRRRVGLAWAAGGALAASLATAALISLPASRPDAPYHALGAATALEKAPANAIVLFSPDLSSQNMRDALTDAGARITDGPLASGGFMLRIDPATRSQRLAKLRGRRGVVMAEPLDAPGPQ